MAKDTPVDAGDVGYHGPRKAREIVDERMIMQEYEFYDSQWGPSYRMTLIRESTGEMMRVSGKHTYVLDWLHAFEDSGKEPPVTLRFSKVGNAFVIKGWAAPLEPEA